MDIENFEENVLDQFEGDNTHRQLEKLLSVTNKWATEREDGGIDEIMMDFGQNGGLFFFTNNESLTSDANIHRAFMELTEELWLDDEIVEDNFDEITAETVGKELGHQIEEFGIAWDFSESMKNAFQSALGDDQ